MERRAPFNRLVIGIGNPLRGDDGLGALLAETAGGRSVQQLTPELAEELARQQAVLFIDAWLAPAGAAPQLVEVLPAAAALDSHRLEPAQLLALSQVLYGSSPRAHLLQMPAHAFAHGTVLSAELQAALPAARALLQGWLAASPRSDA
jgi:hydrogenase maturation protease